MFLVLYFYSIYGTILVIDQFWISLKMFWFYITAPVYLYISYESLQFLVYQ